VPSEKEMIEDFLKSHADTPDRLPTIEEVDRAVEQPMEADPCVVAYLDARPELVELVRRLRRTDPSGPTNRLRPRPFSG